MIRLKRIFLPQTLLFNNYRVIGLLTLLSIAFFVSQSKAAALSGTYTICTSSCTYSTIGAAITDLNKYGVSGPVKFNIYGGNYNESLTIGSISGASATNTITFSGNGSNAAKAGSNGTGPTRVYSSNNDVFYLNGTKYVIFQNMIVDQSGNYHSINTYYTQYCKFNSCFIRSTSTSENNVYENSPLKNIWSNNKISGGITNININQDPSSNSYGQNVWTGNIFIQAYTYAIYSYGSHLNVFDGNYYDSIVNNNGGYSTLYDYYGTGNTWMNNTIKGARVSVAISIISSNDNDNTKPFNILNNIVGTLSAGNSCLGIYIRTNKGNLYNYNLHILFNTISLDKGGCCFELDAGGSAGIEILNNSFNGLGSGYTVYLTMDLSNRMDGNNYSGNTKIFYNNKYYSDFTAYKKAAVLNGHGIYDNKNSMPFKSSTDLHIDQSKEAPLGVKSSITTDIDGDSRCALFPTCGADESNYGKGRKNFSISGNSTSYVGSPTVFLNSANTMDLSTYSWYLDSISNSTKLSDSIHLLTSALTKGTHIIYLVTNFCTGPETASFKVNVINPSKTPVSNFIANKTIVNIADPVSLIDISSNGPTKWAWSISPKTYVDTGGYTRPAFNYLYGTSASSFNPVIQFNVLGKYQICLTAFNSLGYGNTECKSQYIDVVESIDIGYKKLTASSDGLLYGAAAPGRVNYGNGQTLISPCADKVYLVINYFNVSCGNDYLSIYDGTGAGGKLLSKKCGSFYGGLTGADTSKVCANGSSPCLPKTVNDYKSGGAIDTFIATSGSMYVDFSTNSNNSPGFEAYWWSTPSKVSRPTAKFICDDSICVNKPFQFTNTSTGSNMSFLWDLDGNSSRYEYRKSGNPSFSYKKAGLYKVTLIASNCGGSDTFIRTVRVVNPPKPGISFTTDNSKPTPVDVVYLYNDIKECVDSFSWVINKKYPYKSGTTPTVIFVNSTNSNSANPIITLPDTGCWDVVLFATNVSGTVGKYSGCFFNVKAPYCVPQVVKQVPDIGISKVLLKTIANSSSQGTTAYQNFVSNVNTTLEFGGNYTLTVNRNSNTNKINRSVYIDWNNDGDFDDSLEHYVDDNSSSTLSWSVNIKVPPFATEGATVMRIAVNLDGYANKPCGVNEFGEYEDYRIYITRDHFKPWINLRGAIDTLAATDTVYWERGYNYKDRGADAFDELSVGLNSKMKVTASPVFNKLKMGIYKITYNVSDDAGNAADPKTRVIIVGPDKSPPILKVDPPNNIYVEVFKAYTLPSFSAIDSTDGDVTKKVIISGKVDTTRIGVYIVTYSVTDSSGNTATEKRFVNIVDNTPPVITLKGSSNDSICRWHNYTDAGYIVSDNYWPNSDIVVSPEGTFQDFDKLLEGTYSFRYHAQDKSGNDAFSEYRYITVMSPDSKACLSGINNVGDLVRYINVFPNPGTGKFTVSINNPAGDKISISVNDMFGRQIERIENSSMTNNKIELDLSEQPSGIYLLNIMMGDTLVTKRISLNK